MSIANWSPIPGNNDAAPPNGAPEGLAPSNVNNIMRQMMADIRSWYENAQWIDFEHTPTKIDSDTFTVSGDQTAIYDIGRRIKFSGSVSGYGTIASSSYSSPNTTINLTSAAMTGTVTAVSVGIISGTNSAIIDGVAKYADATANFTGSLQKSGVPVPAYSDATANFTGSLQKSGVAVATQVTGTFTGNIGASTATFKYNIVNGICTLSCDSGLTAAGTTTLGIDGLPSVCRPQTPFTNRVAPCPVINNNVSASGVCSVVAGNSVISFFLLSMSGGTAGQYLANIFSTATNNGITNGWQVSYPL